MTHSQEATQGLSGALNESLDVSLVAALVAVCAPMRQAVSMSHAGQRAGILQNTIGSIDSFLDFWRSKPVPIDHVLRAVAWHREGIQSLLSMSPDDPKLPTRIYEWYLSLENIPSQIAAAMEQSQLERGLVPNRHTLLNSLVTLVEAQSYLEIGCCNNDCFNAIGCPQKVGVDPNSGGTLRMTSDAFFAVNAQTFDLIFIDGLHESWQVDKDIEHALRWSSPKALIVLHDCNPLFEVRALVPRVAETWNGDVWKSLVRIRSRVDLDCATGLFDHGCAVIRNRPNSDLIDPVPENALSWSNLVMNRQTWIRPMSYDDLLYWIGR
jgi:hypothetical protein